ncbi:hypothetical protein C8Q79DRAFT_424235 [Trametes meyenii]|nr:hypothetical protein C8Q79DRAFT_424235 [Trametes meyenii]
MSTAFPRPSATTTTGRAPYGPPALRIYTQRQAPQPTNAQIAEERFRQRFKIRFDEHSDNVTAGNNALHPHFCTSSEDRQFAFSEAMGDIEDAAIGAARTADTLFLGFGIQPEWPPSRPLRASDINVRVVATRQFQQTPAFRHALEKIHKIVQEELALPHILALHDKLDAFTPGAGYAFDPETRRIITQPIRLASVSELPAISTRDVPHANVSQHVSSPETPSRSGAMPMQSSLSGVLHRGSATTAVEQAHEPSAPTRLHVPLARVGSTANTTPLGLGSETALARESRSTGVGHSQREHPQSIPQTSQRQASGRPTAEEIAAEIHARCLLRIAQATEHSEATYTAPQGSLVRPSATTEQPTIARAPAQRPTTQIVDDPPPPYSPSREQDESAASSRTSSLTRVSAQR